MSLREITPAEIESLSSWDEAVSVGIDLSTFGSESQWLLGRLANRVADLRPEDPLLKGKVQTLKSFSGAIKQSYNVIKDAARVVKHVSEDMQGEYPELYYGHWREIVRKGKRGEALQHWARLAADSGWTVSHLRAELNGAAGPKAKELVDESMLRKLVGVIQDLDALDLRQAWVENPDDALDALMSCEAIAEKLTSARFALMTEHDAGRQMTIDDMVVRAVVEDAELVEDRASGIDE